LPPSWASLKRHADGASLGNITDALKLRLPSRTLQYRLKHLVDTRRLIKRGEGSRWTKYRLPFTQPAAVVSPAEAKGATEEEAAVPLSPVRADIRPYLAQSLAARKPVGYNREFLDSYRPNEGFYLSQAERAHLAEVGKPNFAAEGAGTYAKQILSRLLIDLSWNSSRLEGNTYSLLDTKRLIEFGQEAEGVTALKRR